MTKNSIPIANPWEGHDDDIRNDPRRQADPSSQNSGNHLTIHNPGKLRAALANVFRPEANPTSAMIIIDPKPSQNTRTERYSTRPRMHNQQQPALMDGTDDITNNTDTRHNFESYLDQNGYEIKQRFPTIEDNDKKALMCNGWPQITSGTIHVVKYEGVPGGFIPSSTTIYLRPDDTTGNKDITLLKQTTDSTAKAQELRAVHFKIKKEDPSEETPDQS